jgi:hypothetical protein
MTFPGSTGGTLQVPNLIYPQSFLPKPFPRYGNLLEVVDGNWMLPGSRQNHEVLEETRPLEARHGPLVCGYALLSIWYMTFPGSTGGTLQVPNLIYPQSFLPKPFP